MKHRIEVRVKNKEKVLDGRVMKLPARLVHWFLGDSLMRRIVPGKQRIPQKKTSRQMMRMPFRGAKTLVRGKTPVRKMSRLIRPNRAHLAGRSQW